MRTKDEPAQQRDDTPAAQAAPGAKYRARAGPAHPQITPELARVLHGCVAAKVDDRYQPRRMSVHISIAAIAQSLRAARRPCTRPCSAATTACRCSAGAILFVPLANVEARLGSRISPEQLDRATAGNPARVLTGPPSREED